MSLMSLGIKINALQKGIKEGRFTAKEQVKAAALELNVSTTAGYENLSEEALLIVKKFFEDFGGLGFCYDEPTPKTEHKMPWVEISAKKTGTYRDFVK